MAELTIDPLPVIASAAASWDSGISGEAVEAGNPIYKDASDSNKLKLATSGGTIEQAAVVGVALHASSAGQPLEYAKSDPSLGGMAAGLDPATPVYLGDTPGSVTDDPSGANFITFLGFALAGEDLQLNIVNGPAFP